MGTKSGKPKSFDTMVKYFLRYYNIPTKKDMERLNIKMDRLESLLHQVNNRKPPGGFHGKFGNTASGVVLEIIQQSQDGIRFVDIMNQTGFEEKKLRNIVFRLSKLGKIQPKSRGVYISAQ